MRTLLGLVLSLLLVTPAWAAITEVNSSQRAVYNTTAAAGEDSGAKAFPGNVTAGNTIIVAGMCWRGGSAPSACTVTDSQGNSYTTITGTTSTTRWFIACATVGSSAANTVTVNPPGGANDYISYAIDEFSGVTSCTADVDGGLATGAATTTPSTTITTVSANDLLIGVWAPSAQNQGGGAQTQGSGWTLIGKNESLGCNGSAGCYPVNVQFKIVTTATSYTVDWTTPSVAYGIYRAAFAPTVTSTGGISRSRAIFLGE